MMQTLQRVEPFPPLVVRREVACQGRKMCQGRTTCRSHASQDQQPRERQRMQPMAPSSMPNSEDGSVQPPAPSSYHGNAELIEPNSLALRGGDLTMPRHSYAMLY